MKDLAQCTVSHDDFQRWLGLGTAPLTICHGEKAVTTLTRLEKNQSVDYLYRAAVEQSGDISWNNSLMFCGVYDRQNQALYLTQDSLSCFTGGQNPFVAVTVPSMKEEISVKINQRVEGIIANDRSNLPVQELSDWKKRDIQNYRDCGAREEAIQLFFKDKEPDAQFHSGYTLDVLPEAAFMVWLQDPENFIQTEAEQYIKCHQEELLLGFLKKDALLAEYQTLMQDTGNPIHRMKAITDAVKASGAKTVTVTVRKDGTELTFKTEAASLTGHRNFYYSSNIAAQDRREFERLFGRYADYTAEDITRITYGRNTIYEPPPVSEDMAEEIGMGMCFG